MRSEKITFPTPLLLFLLLGLSTFTSCKPEVDPCAEKTWYIDADSDGLGDPAKSILACEQPEGYVSNADDDNDICTLAIDECGICGGTGASTWYEDSDEDNLGNPAVSVSQCTQPDGYVANSDDTDDTVNANLSAIEKVFGERIDLGNLSNYANQVIPAYVTKDNTGNNQITDKGATLGRILFYDKNLSVDNTIACASCHQQAAAFGDVSLASQGVAGTTGRHSMRLINTRFSLEDQFFWDERAPSLEQQTTQPIQDHIEMGFSGQDGDPDFDALITKLEALDYYQELFPFVYGDSAITEGRIQRALAQFIRSIQSFDSKFDVGMASSNNLAMDFSNFTAEENEGKRLFIAPRPGGGPGGGANGVGAGCVACHRAPEFDIDPNSRNNGIVGVLGTPGLLDVSITRSPSLRDIVNPNGQMNGALMHDGSIANLEDVIEHYNEIEIIQGNNNLDPRLSDGGQGGPGTIEGQRLALTETEKNAIVAFLKTLTGENVYTDERWSDPFRN